MRQTLACAVVLALVVGCGKAKLPRTTAIDASGTPTSTTPASSDKPNYLANVLKPRGTIKTGVPHNMGVMDPILLTRDGGRMAFCLGKAKMTQVWDITGEPKKVRDLPGKILALAPDGKVYLREGEGEPEVADAETGARIATLEMWGMKYYFRSATALLGLRVSPFEKGKPQEGIVRQFDTATGRTVDQLTFPYTSNSTAVLLG